MTDLLTRLASATACQERELLFEAFNVCCPQPFAGQPGYSEWAEVRHQFKIFANFGAWTSAAEMLLPEGWTYAAYQGPSGQPHRWTLSKIASGERFYTELTSYAPFPWAALAAACVKARG